MELIKITQITKDFGVSVRMLRYYEQEGLLESKRTGDYAYRAYDQAALRRLQHIITLRKLRIPVKQMKAIFKNQDAAEAIEIFQQSISQLDEEITALSTIRAILKQFADELQQKANIRIRLDMLTDPSIVPLIDSLAYTQNQIQAKEKFTISDLDRASEVLNKLKNVRVVYLAPMTVASAHFSGENAEDKAWTAITDFVKQKNLLKIKPDARCFKISHSYGIGNDNGYEIWVSIPDGFHLPAPLVKKQFYGGQYAAYVLGHNEFDPILGLCDWVNESEKYQADYEGNLKRCDPPLQEIDKFGEMWRDILGGIWLDLQEVLNFYNFLKPGFEMQIDFLMPIKDYVPSEDTPVEIPGSKEKCGYKTSIVTKNKFTIMGFAKLITGGSWDDFLDEITADGRLEILNKFRKPGAPILGYGFKDVDADMLGGSRRSFCLLESDINDVQAFMRHHPFVKKIDASRWLIFEYPRNVSFFNGHAMCPKLGYTWNGILSGFFSSIYPDGKVGKSESENGEDMVFCWYPVK